MNAQKTALGYEIHTAEHTIFFGGREAHLENLRAAYPSVDFVRVKQIHGDGIIESPNSFLDLQVPADAHYSRATNLGLCVITADCIPVFLIHPHTGMMAAIHAGWRGVAQRIIPKTIARLHAEGAPNQELAVFVGPHIQKPSFEVGFDVRDMILNSIGQAAVGTADSFYENISTDKALVDLNRVVNEQLHQEGIAEEAIHNLPLDTYRDAFFHSHRREKEKAGRQVSFILRHA